MARYDVMISIGNRTILVSYKTLVERVSQL